MKNVKYLSYLILVVMAFVLVSCQKTVSTGDEKDYLNGYHYGGKIAKQDAIDHACTGSIENPSSNVWFQQKKYLPDLKKTHSPRFIKGFLLGYESSFVEHMNLYCGGPDRYTLEHDRY